MNTFNHATVAAIFDNYPDLYKNALLDIRQLIFKTAKTLPYVGEIEETLKWGQPTYSTKKKKMGTPIRVDRFGDDKIAIFFNCQTSLVEKFRELFGDALEFSKNRAVILDPKKEMPTEKLAICIEMALTYHKKLL